MENEEGNEKHGIGCGGLVAIYFIIAIICVALKIEYVPVLIAIAWIMYKLMFGNKK